MACRHVCLAGESGSYILKDSKRQSITQLNDMAASIWQLCNHEYSVQDIIDVFAEIYNKPSAEVSYDVVSVLESFGGQYLLQLFEDRYFKNEYSDNGVEYHEIPQRLHDSLESFRGLVNDFFPEKRKGPVPSLGHDSLDAALKGDYAKPADKTYLDLKAQRIDGVKCLLLDIKSELELLFPTLGDQRSNSGRTIYGGNSWMGWHTNEDQPGRRIYLNWSEKNGENEFRYLDNQTDEVCIVPEPAGWSMKSFYIPPPPNQLWHCVQVGAKRIAIGFAELQFNQITKII